MVEEQNEETFDALRKKLTPFLENNPDSKLVYTEGLYKIKNPWNDPTLSIIIHDEIQDKIISTLNKLILPPCLSAIYHLDSHEIEYIFMFLKEDDPYYNLSFDFTLDDNDYKCAFREASEELMLIGKTFIPDGEERDTEWRNLWRYRLYWMLENEESYQDDMDAEIWQSNFEEKHPISFFIKGFREYDEEQVIRTSKKLNFLSYYYDRKFPRIIIHTPPCNENNEKSKIVTKLTKDFPKHIRIKTGDETLLDFVSEARNAVPRLSFLYYYMALEYASFYYLESDTKKEILKIFAEPNLLSNVEKYSKEILDKCVKYHENTEKRLENLLTNYCKVDVLWQEIDANKSFFCKKHVYEGGFTSEQLIREKFTLTTFQENRKEKIAKISDILTRMRNALVHGRDKKQISVIKPGKDNEQNIIGWLPIIRRITEQIIIYQEII